MGEFDQFNFVVGWTFLNVTQIPEPISKSWFIWLHKAQICLVRGWWDGKQQKQSQKANDKPEKTMFENYVTNS